MAELTLKDINKTLQDNNDMLENLTSDVSEIGRSLLKDQVDRHRARADGSTAKVRR